MSVWVPKSSGAPNGLRRLVFDDTNTCFMKKDPIAGPTCFEIVGPVMGFLLSAKNLLEMSGRADKCAW